MDGVAPDCEAFAEALVFLQYFNDLPDPRQAGKVMYPLAEVLLLCLLAVLAGAETITDNLHRIHNCELLFITEG